MVREHRTPIVQGHVVLKRNRPLTLHSQQPQACLNEKNVNAERL